MRQRPEHVVMAIVIAIAMVAMVPMLALGAITNTDIRIIIGGSILGALLVFWVMLFAYTLDRIQQGLDRDNETKKAWEQLRANRLRDIELKRRRKS